MRLDQNADNNAGAKPRSGAAMCNLHDVTTSHETIRRLLPAIDDCAGNLAAGQI